MKETLLNVKHLTLGVTERDGSVNKAVERSWASWENPAAVNPSRS